MSYPEIPKEMALQAAPLNSTGNDPALANPNGFKLIPNRIFVGGINRETTEEDLLRYFAGYGNVKSAKIITDINTGASKGYGFVTFASEEEALRLQKFGGIAILHNRKLHIGPAIKRNVAATTTVANVGPANSSNVGQAGTVSGVTNATMATPIKPTEANETINALTGYPHNGLFPGFPLDPATAMLYQPYYGFPFSYLYSGSPGFQFPY